MFDLITVLMLGSALAADPVCVPTADSLDAAGGDACARVWMDRSLRMNDLTAVGTHNSYKLAIPRRGDGGPCWRADRPPWASTTRTGRWPNNWTPAPDRWRSTSSPTRTAASTPGPCTASGAGRRADPASPRPWRGRGSRSLHMPDVDFRSSCLTFVACLTG
jgi:hypothetical protein